MYFKVKVALIFYLIEGSEEQIREFNNKLFDSNWLLKRGTSEWFKEFEILSNLYGSTEDEIQEAMVSAEIKALKFKASFLDDLNRSETISRTYKYNKKNRLIWEVEE